MIVAMTNLLELLDIDIKANICHAHELKRKRKGWMITVDVLKNPEWVKFNFKYSLILNGPFFCEYEET